MSKIIFYIQIKVLRGFIIIASFYLCTFQLNAQLVNPLSTEVNRRMEYRITQVNPSFYTVLQPYVQNDSVYPMEYQSYRSKTDSWFKKKLLHESLVEVDSNDYYLFFDPAFDLALGRDNSGRNTITNTRGFNAGGRLGKNIAFGTSFYENQAIFPNWIDKSINNKIITGQGFGRLGGQTWDYAHVSGYISVNLIRHLNIQLGQGKNFIGDGYRSLLLSDVAYNYPYGKFTYTRKRWMYSWMLGIIQDLSIPKGNDQYTYAKRMISSQVASSNITSWLQLSIIKNTVYNNPDTTGKFQSDLSGFNPVILPVNSKNSHSIWGLNLKALVKEKLWVYSQVAVDNLTADKPKHLAFQVGTKYFDAFGLKGLFVQAEYNSAEPSAYSWDNKTLLWLHYREPLAHPYGNNFSEGIFNVVYSWRRWQFKSFTRLTQQLDNSTGNLPDRAGFPTMLNNTEIIHNNTQVNWFLNPKTTAHFSLGYVAHRESISGKKTNSSMLYFAFRTALFNNYLNY